MVNWVKAKTLVGELYATLELDSSKYEAGTEKAQKATDKFDASVINASATLDVLQKGYGYAKDAAMLYVNAVTKGYAEVETFSRITGMSIEESGYWKDVLENNGLALNDMSAAVRMMSNNVQMAVEDPNSGAAQAFRRLGVSVTDANGNLKSSSQIIQEVITGLQNIRDPVQRNALANDTLGRSYQNLNKLFTTNIDLSAELAGAKSPYDEAGRQKVEAYNKSMAKLNSSIESITVNTGEKLVPVIQVFADFINGTIMPALDGALGSIEELGRQFMLFTIGAAEMAGRAHDVIAGTAIGKIMGLSPFNFSGLDNLRAQVEGTFKGGTTGTGTGTGAESDTGAGAGGETGGTTGTTAEGVTYNKIAKAMLYGKSGAELEAALTSLAGQGIYLTAPEIEKYIAGAYGVPTTEEGGTGGTSGAGELDTSYWVKAVTDLPALREAQMVKLAGVKEQLATKQAEFDTLYRWAMDTKQSAKVAPELRALNAEIDQLSRDIYSIENFINGITEMMNVYGLAEGGIVTRPVLTMLGEKGEDEAVIPLGKSGMNGDIRIVVEVDGYAIGEAVVNKLQLLGVKT